MSKQRFIFIPLFFALSFLFIQCEENIFSFTAPSKSEAGLIENGRLLMNEGEYEAAAAKFAEAMDKNPDRVDARYYHAKATLHASGFNAITLGNLLTDVQEGQNLPFMDMSMDSSNTLYQANNIIISDLRPISKGLLIGDFTKEDIDLDLTIASTASGILGFKDTNNDGTIDANDLVLDALIDGNGEFKISSLEELANDPENLNGLITKADTLLEFAGDLIVDILGDTTGTGFDTETLDELIGEVGGTLTYYYTNTGEPNNPGIGDNDGDGVADEECLDGLDNDGDGLIDEDTLFGKTCN